MVQPALAIIVLAGRVDTLLIALLRAFPCCRTCDPAYDNACDDACATGVAPVLAPVFPVIVVVTVAVPARLCCNGSQQRRKCHGGKQQPPHCCTIWIRVILPSGLLVLQASTSRRSSVPIQSFVSPGAAASLLPTITPWIQ